MLYIVYINMYICTSNYTLASLHVVSWHQMSDVCMFLSFTSPPLIFHVLKPLRQATSLRDQSDQCELVLVPQVVDCQDAWIVGSYTCVCVYMGYSDLHSLQQTLQPIHSPYSSQAILHTMSKIPSVNLLGKECSFKKVSGTIGTSAFYHSAWRLKSTFHRIKPAQGPHVWHAQLSRFSLHETPTIIPIKTGRKGYPFSHNHGSVENHPSNERKLIYWRYTHFPHVPWLWEEGNFFNTLVMSGLPVIFHITSLHSQIPKTTSVEHVFGIWW